MDQKFYLHETKTPAGTFILIDNNPTGEEAPQVFMDADPLVYANGETVKARFGWTLGPVENRTVAEGLAMAIAARYNWDVVIDGARMRLNLEDVDKRLSAQALRAIPSEKRANASRENGKKGGRRTKETQ